MNKTNKEFNDYLWDQIVMIQKIQKDAYLAGMENCGHENFLDNADKAFHEVKDSEAVNN